MWLKMKHGKTTCDANRPKDLKEYAFEVPKRLRETLVTSSIAPDVALALAHHQEEEEGLVDSTDWETEFFSEPEPKKIFSYSGTLQSLCCQERPEHHSLPL